MPSFYCAFKLFLKALAFNLAINCECKDCDTWYKIRKVICRKGLDVFSKFFHSVNHAFVVFVYWKLSWAFNCVYTPLVERLRNERDMEWWIFSFHKHLIRATYHIQIYSIIRPSSFDMQLFKQLYFVMGHKVIFVNMLLRDPSYYIKVFFIFQLNG